MTPSPDSATGSRRRWRDPLERDAQATRRERLASVFVLRGQARRGAYEERRLRGDRSVLLLDEELGLSGHARVDLGLPRGAPGVLGELRAVAVGPGDARRDTEHRGAREKDRSD